MTQVLLARIADSLATLVWFQTEDGAKNRNRPTMITPILTRSARKEAENAGYDTPEEFFEAMKKYEVKNE